MEKIKYSDIFHFALAFLLAIFCLAPKLIALGIILLALVIVFGYTKKELSFKLYKIHFFLAALYILYIIGIAFTNHPDIAKGYAENKLSFLIFPILFSVKPKFELKLGPVILGLCVGLLFTYVYGIINALDCYRNGTGQLLCFTSVNISPIHHPSYFAIFILVAVFGTWHEYFKNASYYKLKWIIPFSIVSMIFFMLCISLSAILFLVVSVIFVILRWIYMHWGKWIFYPILIVFPIIFYFLFINLPVIKEDIKYTQKSAKIFIKDPKEFIKLKQGYKTGNEMRLIMWTITVQEIAEHPLGVGTGNIDDYLSERLKSYGQDEMATKDGNQAIQYNPHNQLLQTTLEIGIFGGLLLTIFVFSALILAWKNKNWFFVLIVASLIFNGTFESMLQRQSGIVFYAFWICILVVMESKSYHRINKKA